MSNQNSNQTADHLQDQLLLAKLINNYHWRADNFDWAGWADSFTEDAEFEFAGGFGMMKGRQQIHDICKDNMDHVYDTMQHVTNDVATYCFGQAASMGAFLTLCTWFEDRTLQAELPGYAEYARQVRYRLLPFVW